MSLAGFKLSFANSPNTSSKLNLAKTFQYKFAKKAHSKALGLALFSSCLFRQCLFG